MCICESDECVCVCICVGICLDLYCVITYLENIYCDYLINSTISSYLKKKKSAAYVIDPEPHLNQYSLP